MGSHPTSNKREVSQRPDPKKFTDLNGLEGRYIFDGTFILFWILIMKLGQLQKNLRERLIQLIKVFPKRVRCEYSRKKGISPIEF
jgi:hypothetical protein